MEEKKRILPHREGRAKFSLTEEVGRKPKFKEKDAICQEKSVFSPQDCEKAIRCTVGMSSSSGRLSVTPAASCLPRVPSTTLSRSSSECIRRQVSIPLNSTPNLTKILKLEEINVELSTSTLNLSLNGNDSNDGNDSNNDNDGNDSMYGNDNNDSNGNDNNNGNYGREVDDEGGALQK